MKDLKPAFGVELDAPYFDEKRWVSPLNWSLEVRDNMHNPDRVLIHDVTLRDGEQTARIAFTPEEKIFLAQEIDKLGVHSIEPGLPATKEDQEVMAELAKMNLNANIVPLVRVKESDVQASFDAGVDGMLLEFAINPYLIRDVYNTDPDSVIDQIVEYSCAAKDAGMYVEFMGWDALRIPDMDYVKKFFCAITERGKLDRITIADTFGMGHPLATYNYIKNLKEWTGASVGYHIHNDYAMATANSIMAVSAGADMIHGSMNGLGERAGNVATEEVAFVLQHLLDIDAGIDLSRLKPLSDLVTEISKTPPARNKAIVGDGLFEVESGIVVHLLDSLKGSALEDCVLPFKPESAGHDPYKVVYGRGTGNHAVRMLLKARNINASDDQVRNITARIKSAALHLKNGLPESFLIQIINEELSK